MDTVFEFDIFVCDASADKDAVACPLARLLEEHSLRVWVDETEILIGDSLRQAPSPAAGPRPSSSKHPRTWPPMSANCPTGRGYPEPVGGPRGRQHAQGVR